MCFGCNFEACCFIIICLLLAFVDNGFTQKDMAVMLGVSRRTVENRMAEFNLTNHTRFSDIDDSSLDAYTERIIGLFPRSSKI